RLVRVADVRAEAGRHGVVVRSPATHLPRRPHGARYYDDAGAVRLLALPDGAAAAATAVPLRRYGSEVPHVGVAGRSEHRRALEPVRGHAEPPHRLGALVWH